MKICFITDTIFSLGGVQRVISVLANEISKNNEVYILCTNSKVSENRNLYKLSSNINVDINSNLMKKNIACKVIYKLIKEVNKQTGILNYKNMVKVATEIYIPKKIQLRFIEYINKNKFDVVIAAEGMYSLLLGCISDKLLNTKTIGWQHNSYEAYLKNSNKYYHYNQDNLFKEYINKLDNYVVLTEHDKKMFKDNMNIDCSVIYNPLSFRSLKKSTCENKNILFVGRLQIVQKGLDFLINSFKKVSEEIDDWNLIIVGDGPDKYKLDKIIKKEELENRVSVFESTNNIEKYYLESSIFISTSRWEGFGLVITEAMECGLPVIAFNNSGPKEIINKNRQNGILVESGDLEKLNNELLYLINNVNQRKTIGENSIKRAKDFYIENIVKEWYNVIQL